YEARFANLEHKDEEKAIHMAKINDEIEKIKKSSINTTPTEIANSSHFVSASCDDNALASDISDDTSVQIRGLTSNSDALQGVTKSRVSNSSSTVSPICVELSHASFPTKSSEDSRSEDAIAFNAIDNFLDEKHNEQIRNKIRERNLEKKLLQSNEASASQAQNSSSDSSSKSYDESHVEQISELQSTSNTPNLSEQSSEQNTDLHKTKIPEIDIQSLIEELRIDPLAEDIVKIVN
ncbi:10792_t:CDS:1, partial [Gigaspora margarita]